MTVGSFDSATAGTPDHGMVKEKMECVLCAQLHWVRQEKAIPTASIDSLAVQRARADRQYVRRSARMCSKM
jgi:hypothetical protein